MPVRAPIWDPWALCFLQRGQEKGSPTFHLAKNRQNLILPEPLELPGQVPCIGRQHRRSRLHSVGAELLRIGSGGGPGRMAGALGKVDAGELADRAEHGEGRAPRTVAPPGAIPHAGGAGLQPRPSCRHTDVPDDHAGAPTPTPRPAAPHRNGDAPRQRTPRRADPHGSRFLTPRCGCAGGGPGAHFRGQRPNCAACSTDRTGPRVAPARRVGSGACTESHAYRPPKPRPAVEVVGAASVRFATPPHWHLR